MLNASLAATKPLSLAFIITVLTLSCATIHPGIEVNSPTMPLAASCKPTDVIQADPFKLIVCTFENQSNSWLNLGIESVSFKNSHHSVKILTPEDIRAFSTAYAEKARMDAWNQDLAIATIGLVGVATMVAGSSSGSSGLNLTGATLVTGAAAYDTGHKLSKTSAHAQHGGLEFGSEHILHRNTIKIPSQLFVRKRLLVEITDYSQLPAELTICFRDNQGCLDLPITNKYRLRDGRTIW